MYIYIKTLRHNTIQREIRIEEKMQLGIAGDPEGCIYCNSKNIKLWNWGCIWMSKVTLSSLFRSSNFRNKLLCFPVIIKTIHCWCSIRGKFREQVSLPFKRLKVSLFHRSLVLWSVKTVWMSVACQSNKN